MGIENGGGGPESERQIKIQAVAEGLKSANFLKPNDKERDRLDDSVGKVFDYLGHGVESVTQIDEAIADFKSKGAKSSFVEAQIKNLRTDREILAEAVTIACRDLTADDPDLESEFFLGPKHIDGLLGGKLAGLGNDVSERKGVPEEIGVELDKLEVMRRKMKGGSTAESKAYVTILKKKIDTIAEKDFEGQFETLMALNEELGKYETSSVGSTGTDNGLKKSIEKLAENVEKMSSGRGDKYRQEQERFGLRPIMDAEGNIIGMESNYNVSPENCAKAMKWMASDLRWSSWTPPEWFSHLPEKEQAKVLVMIAVNTAAANVAYAGKDLMKIFENSQIFSFTKEDMAALFDDDFKLVMSIMLNDLCEVVPDENGIPSLRYKEVVEIDGKGREKRTIEKSVMEKIKYREDYKEELAKKLASEKGHWQTYDQNDKFGHKKGEFILDDRGERIPKPNYLDLMTAYTAWNLFYGMGDSSTCDRLRILPTWNGIISDPIRTMRKAEFKAKNKWRIWKSGLPFDDEEDLLSAEHFGGNVGDYVMRVMEYEKVLDGPISGVEGDELMRDKILRGKNSFFDQTTFYGLLTFANGGRDLVKKEYGVELTKGGQKKFYDRDIAPDGEKKTLAQFLMDYAFRNVVDGSGKVIIDSETKRPKREFIGRDKEKERRDFSFGLEQVTFMNEFRDSMEGGILAYSCMTSKEDFKTVMSLARKLKEKMPMVSDIEFNGQRAFSYTTNPLFWRDVMIGCFGYDSSRLSSDYIALTDIANKDGKAGEQAYSSYVYDMMSNVMGLINGRDVNYYELAKLFGVQIKPGENFRNIGVMTRNMNFVNRERNHTVRVINEFNKKNGKGKPLSAEKIGDITKWEEEIRSLNISHFGDVDLSELEGHFHEAIKNGQYTRASRLYSSIKEIMEFHLN